ncbi:acyl-CoA N-acyltransferase [Halteromyces radiatus]|uniref:acyl-CoA N-acyltransferase n=1 Tax=Halteromyces radiatus TaxID=101107 RepID=UPI00222056AD|nr:acyl-CoA N-acyltransferase [Halteromyces radiatus]KAI8093703.1 acyl-CoA N-acyltransferase [Halteromyces radiatus]
MTTYPLVEIKPAAVQDVPLILNFIRQLAQYEKLAHEVVATEALLEQHLFGPQPKAEVILAYCQRTQDDDKVPVGFALFFHNFSTFLGRPGLYLEDLFVNPDYRGLGLGKKLLIQLAVIAKERDCGRYEWVVLDWNTPSRKFYESLGAETHAEWIIHRVEGQSLDNLASM